MMTFRRGLRDFKLPLSTVWLMSDIAEAKGRQELYTKQSPQILKRCAKWRWWRVSNPPTASKA